MLSTEVNGSVVSFTDIDDPFFIDVFPRIKPHTITSGQGPAPLWALFKSLEYIVRNKIPGDIAECGVWNGGSMLFAAMALIHFGDTSRKIYLYDTFAGTGDSTTAIFQLTKTYGSAFNPWTRAITKPVAGTVLVAVAGVTQTPVTAYGVDTITGLVAFQPGHVPTADAIITAGFEFDVPVRFDTDKLEINIQGFRHGAIPSIPIVEIRV